MKGHRVAAVGCPRPIRGPAADGDLLAAEKRSVTDHGAGTALTLQAVAHGDARWFALGSKVKLAAAASGASGGHGLTPVLSVYAQCKRPAREKTSPFDFQRARTTHRDAWRKFERRVPRETQGRQASADLLQDHAPLQPCERRAEAVVHAVSE